MAEDSSPTRVRVVSDYRLRWLTPNLWGNAFPGDIVYTDRGEREVVARRTVGGKHFMLLKLPEPIEEYLKRTGQSDSASSS